MIAAVTQAAAMAAAPRPRAPPLRMDGLSTNAVALRAAWDRGETASALRPLVEACSTESAAAAIGTASSSVEWAGLWLARIECVQHLECSLLRL